MLGALNSKFLKFRNIYQNMQIRKQTVDLFINGTPVTVPSYFTIGQALKREKVVVPNFCYHERLSIAGNCRVCLVEVEGWNKPQISCAMPVGKGMRIRTNSPETLRAQEGVLEFILIDHPLDCPICDQGGECDLQDLTMRFGSDRSRFTDIHFDGKRAVEGKELSPLIRAVMTRCIHCTRCIRFASQVCGLDILGTTGRGSDMLVGTFVDKMFFSEMSGNIIDLCPVGALTSIPYMFKARPWELRKTNSIDVTDATGTNIIIDSRYDRVIRVLPREHEEINQEWLSDKGRWAIDSLEMQRLVTPMKKIKQGCCTFDWASALKETCQIIKGVSPDKILAISGPHTNVETLVACKDFLNLLGSEHTYTEQGLCSLGTGADIRAGYSLNIRMCDVAQADKILFIGTNPRFEAPILNTWIRQAYRSNEADIFAIGPKCDYNYHVTYLGDTVDALSQAKDALECAKKPLIFIGVEQLNTTYGGKIISELSKLAECKKCEDWEVLHVIPLEASFIGALEAGWKPGAINMIKKSSNIELIISLGADRIFYNWQQSSGTKLKIIYIGFQGDRGSEVANLILPGSAYTESGGLYLNMECRSQFALPAVTPPGKARHDWKIIRAIAECCGVNLPYSDHNSLCCRLAEISPLFTYLGNYEPKLFSNLAWSMVTGGDDVDNCQVQVEMTKIADYYCSDIFTYNSPTMVMTKKAAKEFANSCYSSL
ncbi:unnamed protein product [Arctia plantaginis]|uniref:NADH-ubiquinone oxidoreductase 75 kDa subunit, mitochondrial n=1 Tax=Arctia plantaginis TaxID=874455 RepID=A0A8S0YVK4_ARCPL|nr:unnamed protein product [Arctia plantaginis]